MSSANTFDRYARDYDATVQAAIWASGESVAYFAELKAQLVREYAPMGAERVLDFGCGIGNMTRALARELPAAQVTGVDESEASLAAARKASVATIGFERLSEPLLPFADGSFDVVTAACVYHHIHRDARHGWVKEAHRVLRLGGRFMMFEHNPLNPLTRLVVSRVPFDRDAVLLTMSETRNTLQRAGFRLVTARYYFFFPRALSRLRLLERWLARVPLGAQYVVVGERVT